MSGIGRSSAGLGYRIPSLGWRITVGALRLIPMVLLLVGLPGAALAFLTSQGIAVPLSILTVTAFGVVICVLSTARYVEKPTRLYGPLAVATAAVVLVYLLILVSISTWSLTLPNGESTLTITYQEFVEILLLVPILTLLAGVVTTIEDSRSPGERLPFDFPP